MPGAISTNTVQKLNECLGGEWRSTDQGEEVKGYSSLFPAFTSGAVVGVVNALAAQSGIEVHRGGGALSFAGEASAQLLGNSPSAPRRVVIPEKIAENPVFQGNLTSETRRDITRQAADQLQHAAMQGVQR